MNDLLMPGQRVLEDPVAGASVQGHPRRAAHSPHTPGDEQAAEMLARMLRIAPRGLAAAVDPADGSVAQTVRGVLGADGVHVVREGRSLRYAAITALGAARLPEATQRTVLGGRTAADLAADCVTRARSAEDLGSVALACWASAELVAEYDGALVVRLLGALSSGQPLPTVTVAWALTAAVAAAAVADDRRTAERLVVLARRRLRSGRGREGLYPHVLPGGRGRRPHSWRAHVGSFADQVYPLQALARTAATTGDPAALAAAELTAHQLVTLQGRAGQWWWHYDSRTGSVVERFPVYSVHQHAMAPMVLHDLAAAGGTLHSEPIERGLRWLDRHPETVEELISDRFGLIWRKVGRREPRKAARGVGALATAVRPGAEVPGLDRLLPAGPVDHECRPYELGWLLYAWLPIGGAR